MKTFDIKEVVLIAALVLTWLFWAHDDYSLKQEKKELKKQLKQADKIISQQDEIIHKASGEDFVHTERIDSIQQLRDENNTIKFNHSDIDSIRRIWAIEFGN